METVGSRFKKLIESEAASIQDFCDKFGFIYNSIQPITKDKRELGINIVKELVRQIPDLNTHWLLFGHGNMKFSFYDIKEQHNQVAEAGSDLMEELLLKYLSSQRVKNKIGEIVREKLSELQLQPGGDNQFIEKLSGVVEKGLGYEKRGRKKY